MSNAPGFSIPDKARRRSACHRRTNSGELDVFEAEHYFSSTATENLSHTTTTITIPHKIGIISTREIENYKNTNSRQLGNWRQGRASLDTPRVIKHHTLSQPQNILLDQPIKPNIEKKKHKQPSSPGGKLANFFISLINQIVSEKKKSTKSGSQSVKDIVEEDSPSGWRRRRRSSISHFRTTTNSTAAAAATKTTMSEIDAKSIKSCSGFRIPPPYMINTSIKPYKEFKTAFSKYNNSSATTPKPNLGKGNLDWLDEKFKIVKGLSSEKHSSSRDFREAELESRKLKIFMEEDGDESDSSSDLFELQLNYDHHRHRQLGYCASDLPVYESTHMDTIKISSTTPITNGPFRN